MSGLGFGWFAGLASSGGRLEVSVAGVDFGCEALGGGDLLEQRCKLFYLGDLEAGTHELVMSACEVADLSKGFGAARCEVKGIEAAVLGVGSAGDEFA